MACCECLAKYCRAPFLLAISLLQIGAAVAIINIVFFHMTDFDYTPARDVVDTGSVEITNYKCALRDVNGANDLCIYYGYVVPGASLVATLILMISACLWCACWSYIDIWVDIVFTILGMLWWAAAAVVVTIYTTDTNRENGEKTNWRRVVVALGWVEVLLFFLQYIVAQSRLCYKVCGCCGGREAAAKRRAAEQARKDAAATNAATAAGPAYATNAPSQIYAYPTSGATSPRPDATAQLQGPSPVDIESQKAQNTTSATSRFRSFFTRTKAPLTG